MGDVGLMGMRVPGASWRETREAAVLAEQLGYSCLTMGESWGEDALTSLAQLAAQMQILGTAAVVLIVATAAAVYEDTQARTRNATFISIASQLQYHTQRLAKAAGLAARGQAAAFPQLEDSRNQIAQYLKVLREGGEALGVTLPSAASNEELAGRLSDLEKRWPATTRTRRSSSPRRRT